MKMKYAMKNSNRCGPQAKQEKSDLPASRFFASGATSVLFAIALATLSDPSHAQSERYDYEDDNKAWEEAATELPAAPQPQDLLSFPVGVTNPYSFAIDTKSLKIGTDGVVRYTLVGTSSAGARNVSHEGIRCQTFEKKLYAFGRPDGSWSKSRGNKWERIKRYHAADHHETLALDYFCQNVTIAGTEKDLLDRFRLKRPLARVP
jgi:CNP1-like family